MSALSLALAAGAVAIGALLQGAVGFGLALVSVPLLALIDTRLVPGPVIFASLVLTALMAVRGRGHIDRTGLVWGLLGRLPGTVLGALALTAIPLDQMGVVLGALVLVAVLMSLSGLRLQPTPNTLVTAGVLSGFMGTVSSIGGPPMALVYQHGTGSRLRGTLAAYFVIGALFSLIALWCVGRFGWPELTWALCMAPGTLVGYALSQPLVPLVDRGFTRASVLAVSSAAAVLAIVRQLL